RGHRRGRPRAVERGVRDGPGRPHGTARAGLLPRGAHAVRLRPVPGRLAVSSSAPTQLLAILIGGLTGAALFLAIVALYGLPPRRPGSGSSRLDRLRRDVLSG